MSKEVESREEEYLKNEQGKMSDDELDAVAGGNDPIWEKSGCCRCGRPIERGRYSSCPDCGARW